MSSFLFRAELDPTKLDLRDEVRPDHLAYQASLQNLAGGPLFGPDGTPTGSMTIFEAASVDDARARVLADPYMAAGVIASWTLDHVDLKVWTSGPTDSA